MSGSETWIHMSKLLASYKKFRLSSAVKSGDSMSPRRLKPPKRRMLKPATWRRPKPVYAPLSKARHILVRSIRTSWESKKTIGGITLVYGLGIILLVRGLLSNQDFTTVKNLLDNLLTGTGGKIESTLLQVNALFGSSGSITTSGGNIYQVIILIVCSLAIIWVLRQAQAKKKVSTKAAFYEGMYPLVPFLLVLILVSVQLLPLLGASYLYKSLIGNGVAVLWQEKLVSYTAIGLLGYWSLRMITGSLFAFYVVTLPGMTPMRALRSAQNLVVGRRLLVWRKLLFLPLLLLVATTILIIPFLLFLTPTVVWVFFILSTFWFTVSHGYLYALYRELIKDA